MIGDSICPGCLGGTDHRVILCFDDGETLPMVMCEPCVTKGQRELERFRLIFVALISGGISNRVANDVVIAYMRSVEDVSVH